MSLLNLPKESEYLGVKTHRKRIVVTGGAGFVGSHLCEFLLNKGEEVYCIDNCSTGNKENIKHLLDHKNFEFIRHDIRYPIAIECDQIYNLACCAAPIHYQSDPIKTWQSCVLGVMNMLELARQCKATFLQASTSEVYGNPTVHPQVETYNGNVNPVGPRSCYDEGKRAAESLIMDYFRVYKMPIRIVRIFNTYGPKMNPYDGRVVSNFICQALKGMDITIYGDGSQTRSFQYIDDLLEGMFLLMNCQEVAPLPVNIGNPGEFTVKELAEIVVKKTDSKSKIIYKNLPTDDPTKRKPDITRAKTLLGWEPKIPLDVGLNKTIEYFRNCDFSAIRYPREYDNDSVLFQK